MIEIMENQDVIIIDDADKTAKSSRKRGRDENGLQFPTQSKRQRGTSIARDPSSGPIVDLLYTIRRSVLYPLMDIPSLLRLGETCRGFQKDMFTVASGYLWLPARWKENLSEIMNPSIITWTTPAVGLTVFYRAWKHLADGLYHSKLTRRITDAGQLLEITHYSIPVPKEKEGTQRKGVEVYLNCARSSVSVDRGLLLADTRDITPTRPMPWYNRDEWNTFINNMAQGFSELNRALHARRNLPDELVQERREYKGFVEANMKTVQRLLANIPATKPSAKPYYYDHYINYYKKAIKILEEMRAKAKVMEDIDEFIDGYLIPTGEKPDDEISASSDGREGVNEKD